MSVEKFARARELLVEHDIDAWLVVCNEDSDVHSRYLLGVASHALNFILVTTKGPHRVLAVTMEAPMIRKQVRDAGDAIQVSAFSGTLSLMDQLKTLLPSGGRVALDMGSDPFSRGGTAYADYLRVGQFEQIKRVAPAVKFVSAAPVIYQMRSVKSDREIAVLKEAVAVTQEVLDSVPEWVRPGMTEREVKARIEAEYLKVGEPAFETIVATGAHAADPHHNSSAAKIKPGVLLIDTGVSLGEMASDITWTYWVGGAPPADFEDAYDALYHAKIQTNEAMRAGASINYPAQRCREYLAERGYDHEQLFFHGLGHALGFQAHDVGPSCSWKADPDLTFEANMVYTNEPGLYWEGKFGIREEDDVVIRPDGAEVLSRTPPEPIQI